MTLTKTPICNFGEKANNFNLLSTDNKTISLKDIKGKKGTLIMFICNHCPYVKAVIKDIVNDAKYFDSIGIKSVAIMSNDTTNYPEDSFDNMVKFAKQNNFNFPYLIDKDQQIAKKYKAVCTPDIYGFNKDKILKYRGRIDSGMMTNDNKDIKRELFNAMVLISNTNDGPTKQFNSFGCSIKWINNE